MAKLTHHILKPGESIELQGRVLHSQIDKEKGDYHVLEVLGMGLLKENPRVPPQP